MWSIALFSLWSFGASYGVGLSLCRIIAQVVGKVSQFYFVLIRESIPGRDLVDFQVSVNVKC